MYSFYHESGVHYRQELIRDRCGKPACKSCPHGPYWYAYSRRGAFLKKMYIGRKLPPAVAAMVPQEWNE
jgi:hypothetical protein